MEAFDQGKGKQYTIADDKGPKAVVLRSKQGVFITEAYDDLLKNKKTIFGQSSFMVQSLDGSVVVVASQKKVIGYNVVHDAVIYEGNFNYIYSLTLSPNGTFVQLLQKIDQNEGITHLFSLPKMQKLVQFKQNAYTNYYSKTSYPLIRFTSDDNTYFRYNTKLLEVYDSQSHKLKRQIKCGPLQFFEVSLISTTQNYLVACLYLDKKLNQGTVNLYSSFSQEAIYTKNIKKAEEIRLRFSPKSNQFLMELQTYYDPTGKSYYGEYGLYLYNDTTKKIHKVKTANGPLHDFRWDMEGQRFIVISGFMPAESVLFAKNGDKIMEMGKHHRNRIIWGNLGRFVIIAGFGNLSGEIQIWDLKNQKKIGYCKSNSASHCEWAPDDRKFLTSILTPRLRVDNGLKIFAYTGRLLSKTDFSNTELYDTQWIHCLKDNKKQPKGLSPGRKVEVQVKKQEGKFRAFSDALDFDTMPFYNPHAKKKEQTKLAPGQHPEDIPKKKKRKRYKKNQEEKEEDELQP